MPDLTADEEAAWRVRRTQAMSAAFPWIAAIFLVAPVAWWPTDVWVFAEFPRAREAMTWLRVGAAAASLTGLAALWSPLGRAHPLWVGCTIALAEATWAGVCMGHAGGLDGPWPYYLYLVPLVSFALLTDFGPRLAAALGLSVCTFGGYFGSEPSWAQHPLLAATLSFAVFSAGFAAVVGHGITLLMRASFIQGRRVERLAASLESRVVAQTAELRALAHRLETLREEERSWMAREVHDELGQELAALQYATQYARGRAAAGPDAAVRAVDELERVLSRTRETVRRMVRYLRPRVLDERGVVPALEWLVGDVASRTGLSIGLTVGPDAREATDGAVSPDGATAVFRAAQELLTNAVRHGGGQAVRVVVRVDAAPRALVVEVENDGVSLPERPFERGAGMVGVRERLAAAGGAATWAERRNGGVTATVRLPLSPPRDGTPTAS